MRLQSPDPRYGESLYYIDPQGVRYGMPNEDTAKTLGLTGPMTAPWQVVSLLVDGPVLSKQAALLEHDTLPADPEPTQDRRTATCSCREWTREAADDHQEVHPDHQAGTASDARRDQRHAAG